MIAERETAADGNDQPRRRPPWTEGTVPLSCPEGGAEDELQRRLEIVHSLERRTRKTRLALLAVAAIALFGGASLLASSLGSQRGGGALAGRHSTPPVKGQSPPAGIAAPIPVRRARPGITRGRGPRHLKGAKRGAKSRERDGEGAKRFFPPPSEAAASTAGAEASYEAAEADAAHEPVAPESIDPAPVSPPPAASESEFGFEH